MDSNSNVTMDAIITFLWQAGASTPPEAAGLTRAAVNILFAISEEGAKTAEDALDILHNYRLQAKQYATLQRKHLTAGKPSKGQTHGLCPRRLHLLLGR